jgi:5-methylcytosine-specific restriction endonuclease McrA
VLHKTNLYKKELIFICCEICGYDKYVTRHRIRPGKKGGRYAPENVIGLCPNCHIEAELKLISPLTLLSIIYDRIKKERENILSCRGRS